MSDAEYSPGEGRHYFERPETFLNRSMRWIADRRAHAELPQSEIDGLRDNSMAVFADIVVDHEALEQVRATTRWYMSDDSCPSMVLSGEVTVDDSEQNPEVRFFEDAPVLAIRKARRREANLLGAADHFTGHLYAYFTGAVDYDEHAAVYWQNRAAVARAEAGDSRFRLRPFLNPIVYKHHKGIPYDVYSPRSLPFMGALALDAPRVENCRLRYPEVAGWTRVTTDSNLSGIITSYRRDIPTIDQSDVVVPSKSRDTMAQPGGQDTLWSVDFTGKDARALT